MPMMFAAAWESLATTDQREAIRALAEIHIHPPGRGAVKFKPETVIIDWKS
jgi:hypothetical protein